MGRGPHVERNGERVCHRVHNPGFKVRVLVSLHAHLLERNPDLPGGASGQRKEAQEIEETSEEKDRGNPQEVKNDPKKRHTHRGAGDPRRHPSLRQGTCRPGGEERDSGRPRSRGGATRRIRATRSERKCTPREVDPVGETPKGATGLDLEPVSAWKQNRTRAIWKATLAKKTPGDRARGGGRWAMEREEKTSRRLARDEERTSGRRGTSGSQGVTGESHEAVPVVQW